MIRKHIIFFGRVQGVGFRYQANHYAKKYNLTGWVMNLTSGQVEMEVQGDENNINQMLNELDKQMIIEIMGVEHETIPLIKESDFSIRHR